MRDPLEMFIRRYPEWGPYINKLDYTCSDIDDAVRFIWCRSDKVGWVDMMTGKSNMILSPHNMGFI